MLTNILVHNLDWTQLDWTQFSSIFSILASISTIIYRLAMYQRKCNE